MCSMAGNGLAFVYPWMMRHLVLHHRVTGSMLRRLHVMLRYQRTSTKT